ncbi:MAG: shikimate dehydrogenase [Rhodospirillales bacterium]
MNAGGTFLLSGVLGWPIGHSRSPRLHGHWLKRYGIEGAYLPFAVTPESLPAAVAGLQALGFRGANVTVPHKEAVLKLCDRLTASARAIGAVNTLVFDDRGLLGDNSDAFGFLENLRQAQLGWSPSGKNCLVLGAGGAARAVVWSLLDAGAAKVTLVNRSRQRAEALAQEFSGEALPWEQRVEALAGRDLLVNTTSLGMQGQPSLDLDLTHLPRGALVADLVYAPLRTDLLVRAAARGCATVDGLGMLLHQARPGFAAWFGRKPVVDDALRSAVLAETS